MSRGAHGTGLTVAPAPAPEGGAGTDASTPDCSITLCPDGPLLVRGDVTLLDSAGQPLPRTRNVVALCRCGGSAIKPFCDGTHKVNGFTSDD